MQNECLLTANAFYNIQRKQSLTKNAILQGINNNSLTAAHRVGGDYERTILYQNCVSDSQNNVFDRQKDKRKLQI